MQLVVWVFAVSFLGIWVAWYLRASRSRLGKRVSMIKSVKVVDVRRKYQVPNP